MSHCRPIQLERKEIFTYCRFDFHSLMGDQSLLELAIDRINRNTFGSASFIRYPALLYNHFVFQICNSINESSCPFSQSFICRRLLACLIHRFMRGAEIMPILEEVKCPHQALFADSTLAFGVFSDELSNFSDEGSRSTAKSNEA